MQGAHSSNGSQQSSIFMGALQGANSLFTPRRVGYTVAGAFVFAGAALALNTGSAAHTDTGASSGVQRLNVQQSSANTPNTPPLQPPTDQPQSSSSSSTSTHFSATTNSDGSTDTHLNVNGQNIPVPQNGSTSQTITNSDGSTTNVDAHGNTITNGGSSNSSSSSFSINVNSSSSSSGGTTSQ